MRSWRLVPPMLDSSNPYRSWENKLQMWRLVWGVDKKEQGITVLLQLLYNKKAQKTVLNLTSAERYTENSLNLLLEKLDAAFQWKDVKDTHTFF